jgi:ribosomal protein L11 methyltransferase
MNYFLFQILAGYALPDVQRELEEKGLKDIYIIEDDSTGTIHIGGRSKKQITTDKALLTQQTGEIDWEEQWSLFAENFRDGKANIDLSPFGSAETIFLHPGPGFGDLSHPTTSLMLEMMKGKVHRETVVDIGTGSGILTIAAIKLGAEYAYGIDIDLAAVKHARENGKLNRIMSQARFSKSLPKKLSSSNIFLMNMIFPEQQLFNPARYNSKAKLWVISGILENQRDEYLSQALSWDWQLEEEYSRSEWKGFVFSV